MSKKCCKFRRRIRKFGERVYEILKDEDIMPEKKRKKIVLVPEETKKKDKVPVIVNKFLAVLICLNVLMVVLGSVDEFRNKFTLLYNVIEIFSIAVFSIEYMLRLWVNSPKFNKNASRKPYCLSFWGIIDLAAILPSLIYIFFPFLGVKIDLRIIRVLRIGRFMRVVRVPQLKSAARMIIRVIKKQKQKLIVSVCFFTMMILVAAAFMYLFERNSQPDIFPNIPAAIWWAVGSLTTVGYGSEPVTFLGRVLGVIIAILGIGLVAMPTGIISTGFIAETGFIHLPSAKKDVTEIEPVNLSNVGTLWYFYHMLGQVIEIIIRKLDFRLQEDDIRKPGITSNGYGKYLRYETKASQYVHFWIGVRFPEGIMHIYVKCVDNSFCPENEADILKNLKPGKYFAEVEHNDYHIRIPLKNEHYAKLCRNIDAKEQKEVIQNFMEEVLDKLKG